MIDIGEKTLIAIDNGIKADQGNSYRNWLGRVMPHMHDAYRSDEDGYRSHLGASILGGECLRATWYSWRWVSNEVFEGRTLRLFNRGHMEEGRFIAMLLASNINVYQHDENGNQFRISFAQGHAGGSGDGWVLGIPDLPVGRRALLEFKTHNDNSFRAMAGKNWKKVAEKILKNQPWRKDFEGAGVKVAKPEHYVQMQLYMRYMQVDSAVYFAVNKNDDHVYIEIIHVNPEFADMWADVGTKMVYMDKAPPRMKYASPSYIKCDWCKHKTVCFRKAIPELNCRTCVFSAPKEDGTWHCSKFNVTLDKDAQVKGCQSHSVLPGLYS